MRILSVNLAGRSYPIFIGSGARAQVPERLRELGTPSRVVVVADETVHRLHWPALSSQLSPDTQAVLVPPGEASKTIAQASRVYDRLAELRIERRDVLITFGGGVIGDLGGFVAATWLRGIRFMQVPTSVEAAIDASVGGKTGVNHAAGKNLIGAFHQPSAVVIDTEFLGSLPRRDFVAGLAESIKHALLRDPALVAWHEDSAEQIGQRDAEALEMLLTRNCEIKAEVVARDEREDGERRILNYGHTIGHAIEHVLEYELRHGECVGLGILAENEIAAGRGLMSRETADRVRRLIERVGLPTQLPRRLDGDEIVRAIRMDKKSSGGRVPFSLVDEPGHCVTVSDVTDVEVASAIATISVGRG